MDFFFSLKSTFKYLQPYLNYMKDDPPTSHHSSPVGQGPFNVMRGGGSSSCLWAGLGSQPQTHPTGRNSAEQGAESGFPTNNIHGGAINDKDFEQLQESRALFLVCAHCRGSAGTAVPGVWSNCTMLVTQSHPRVQLNQIQLEQKKHFCLQFFLWSN